MFRVSEEQIEFIINDIKQRGVELEDLQNNLLDHICCILEKNYKEGDNFETLYDATIKQFFKHALWEIEEETILLLKYKNYYKMKRFLYILLFVSIAFNILMFARMGYEYYKEQEHFNSFSPAKGITLQEGYEDLVATLKKEHPEALNKKYLCIYFIGDPMSNYEKENYYYFPVDDDTANISKMKLNHCYELKQIDSVASIYKKNVSFVFAYKHNHEIVLKQQMIYKYLFKNVIIINNQSKLYSGFCNERRDKIGLTQNLFVLDNEGKAVYVCKYFIEQHIFLSRFLKTISK